ncbi:uncharacterized protein LOC111611339 [Xiphophorus maculatus]|uniref:uncharacterized protein LOC111611339 n=1 Tax=Xiphophorus maculatus TaxID=8083 RepID=UPI000C6D3DB5|nr:uncharacterized protein LOC111611339 [Xiphophorus maculatus]
MITAREKQTSLFVTLMLHLTATAAEQDLFSTVRVGDEVTLPCGNVTCTKNQCDSITWMFSGKGTITLFEKGQIHEAAAAKSDRLSVTSDCSLVIKNVSVEDVGLYTYRRYVNGQQESDVYIYLSVIHMVQQKQKDQIILTCSVMDYNDCRHTVKWLNEGREEMSSDMEESDQSCSATVTIPASDRNWKLNSENLKCKVTNSFSNKVQLFNFRIQSSGGKTDKNSTSKTTTTTRPARTTTRMSTTTKITATKLPATLSTVTAEPNKLTSMAINSSTNVDFSKHPGWVWSLVIRPVCLAAMIVTVLVIIRWTKTKGNKTIEEESKTEDEDDLTPKRPKTPRNKPELSVISDCLQERQRGAMITAREKQTSLFVTLMLYLTAADGPHYSAVRDGDKVTLPCGNVINIRNHCNSITWIFTKNSRTSTLFEKGQIHKDAAAKSDRLSVTSDCSLVIKKVSVEDVGLYNCRQFINRQQRSDSNNLLSVIQMVEQKQKDQIILTCSVTDYNDCRHTVKWLNEGREEMLSDMEESDQSCSATVTIPASDRNWKLNSENLKCKVTNSFSNKVQLFDYRIQSSGGKTDTNSIAKTMTTTRPARTTTRMSTPKITATKLPATLSTTTAESLNKLTSMAINSSTNVDFSKHPGWVWSLVIRPVCLAAMIVTVLVIIRWTKTKGNKTIEEESKTEDEDDLTPKRPKTPRNKPELSVISDCLQERQRGAMITAREKQTSFFVTLMLHLTAAAVETQYSAVRVGDKVTLPCRNVINIRNHCNSITWIFTKNSRTSTLFEKGQIHKDAAAKSDRLSVTSDCSLVIKKVSVEDVGLYNCRQFINGQQRSDSDNILSVIQMVEQKQKDQIILTCSVMDYNDCRHTVKWLNEGREEMLSDMEESDQSCSATVTIPASDRNWKLNSENLKCKVTNSFSNKVQLFNFRIQSSGGKTAKTTTTTRPARTTTTRMSTTTKITATKLPATLSTVTAEPNKLTSMAINSSTNVNNFSKTPGWSMFYIIGPAVTIVTVLVIIGWKKTRENKTKKEKERETDPEDDIHYAKISQTKKTKKKPRVPDTVTYSTVNTSSSAQATVDLDHLYSTLSK